MHQHVHFSLYKIFIIECSHFVLWQNVLSVYHRVFTNATSLVLTSITKVYSAFLISVIVAACRGEGGDCLFADHL